MKPYLGPLAICLSLACCGGRPEAGAKPNTAALVAVTTVAVEAAQWPSLYEATGTVQARTTTVIAARMMGTVAEVRVQAGDHVRAGQLLVSLDARDLGVNSRRAAAGLEEVRSSIPEADSAIKLAEAQLDLAQSTFGRMRQLFEKKSISHQEFDEASAKLRSAQAGLDMARARRAQLDAQAARMQQDVQATEISRGYAQIAAPFSGVVTARTAEPGMLATPGSPLLTLEREGAYRLEVSVEESRLRSLRVGQPVSVTLDGLNRSWAARVSEILPTVDSASRAYSVRIDLPAALQVRSGAFGRATFELATRPVLSVPGAAITERGQLQSVFVAEQGSARARLISTGQRHQEAVEVLSGLTVGEKVIVPLPPGLADGARVEVRQ